MYWDSDISSPTMDILKLISYQNKYIANLIDVIITIKNNKNIKYFALVGPSIILVTYHIVTIEKINV
jgi:hypothetical protein